MINAITSAGLWLGILGLAGLILVYLYEVAARYAFDAPTSWASDVVSYVLSVSVFLTMPRVTAEGAHVAMTFFIQRFSKQKATVLTIVLNLIAASVCIAIAVVSGSENLRQIERGAMTVATHPIPKWWVSIFITYGFALSAWHFLASLKTPQGAGEIGD